jgi:hypothetical protein
VYARFLSLDVLSRRADSIYYQLEQESLVFGGSTITTTDLTVHTNPDQSGIGDKNKVKDLDLDIVIGGQKAIYNLLSVRVTIPSREILLTGLYKSPRLIK